MTLREHLEQQRATDPRFRELWDSGRALDAALERCLDAWIAEDPEGEIAPLERGLLIHALNDAIHQVFWFRQQGCGFKVIRQKRPGGRLDTGDMMP